MRIKRWVDFIKESKLTINDLNLPVNGRLRGDVFIDKIENGEEFEKNDGDKVIIDPEISNNLTTLDKYDHDKAKKILVDTSGRYKNALKNNKFNDFIKLNQLKKTSEFGSTSKTISGNTRNSIRDVESIQSLYLAYYQKYKNFEDIEMDFDKVIDKIKIPIELNYNIVSGYPDWVFTFEETCRLFFDYDSQIVDKSKTYNFHQISSGSKLMVYLCDVYKQCCDITLGKVVEISKFTPSDIWVINQSEEERIIDELKVCSTLDELTECINGNFASGDLIGLSLKKIVNNDRSTIVANNISKKPLYKIHDIKNISLKSLLMTKSVNLRLLKTIDGYDRNLEEIVVLKSNSSGFSDINLEILGSSSRGGKCSLSTINEYLKHYDLKEVPGYSKLKDKKVEQLEKEILELGKRLSDSGVISGEYTSRNIKQMNEPELISKYQALLLIEILFSRNEDGNYNGDEVMQSILWYAQAIQWFLGKKVNPYVCPCYLRVIEYSKILE